MFRKIIFLIGIAALVYTDEQCGTETTPCKICNKNSDGRKECKCPEGFEESFQQCVDENECFRFEEPCDQECENTIGSYKCSCEPGYVLQDDKHTCKNTTENGSKESNTEQKSIETTSNATESSATADAAATTSTTTPSPTEATDPADSDKSDESSEESDESKKNPMVTMSENSEADNKNRYESSNADSSDVLGNAILYFSVDDEIKAYSLANNNVWTIIGSLDRARSLSINGNDLYWSDTYPSKQKIVRSTISGTEARIHVLPDEHSGLISAKEVEVDWITGNIYYVEPVLRHIGVCSRHGAQCTALVTKNVIDPKSIALNPKRGEMYWSDWGAPARISRANMDGTQETAFVSTSNIQPQGLTIDYPEQTLYWTDYSTHSINRIMLNGTGKKVLLELYGQFQPFSLAVHKNLLYWSDIGGRSVMSCDKNTGGNLRPVFEEKEKAIYGISIYDPDEELYRSLKNPCAMPRLCDDLCLLKGPQGHSCACFYNKRLKNDFKSCENANIMMNVGQLTSCDAKANKFRCRTGECIPKNQECDGFSDCEDSSDEHDRCTTIGRTTKNLPSVITSNLPCTVNNMPHNYLIVKNPLYDVDKNTQLHLEAQNVIHVDVYPAKYAHAYIDGNRNLILNFKQINEREEPSKSADMYYYSFTLRLNCYNGAYVNMFTKVPVIDTNTYDPVFEKPSYTIKLISKAASDFETVHKLNRIIATDHDVTNGKLEFSMSKNEYFDVVYDGVVPNSLGKKHYAKLIPKSGEIKRNVHADIFVADSGNPVKTGWAKLNILLPSSPVPIFTKAFYIGNYYSNTAALDMNEYPKLQDSAYFGSMGFVLEPSTYFTLFPNQDEIIIKCSQRIPYDVVIANSYMALELRAGDISSFSDSNSKTVIIINLHR